ncbi:MAG: helix-turn-helix domain-containing protein [Protaetiibacter sp.]
MTRSPERDAAARERAREGILEAAFEVIGERGYHEASIGEITRRAGVAQGLANYHFGSKEQLVAAVLDRWFAENLAIACAPGTPDERLAGFIDTVLAGAVRELPRQRILVAMGVQPSTHPLVAEAEQRNAVIVDGFECAIRGLFAERGAADPALEETMLRSVLEGVIVKLAIYGDSYPVQGARRWLYRVYGLPEPGPLPAAGADADEIRMRARPVTPPGGREPKG